VEPVPTFNASRVDGTKALTITEQEFQQQILPATFYTALPASVTYNDTTTGLPVATINPRLGTYVWGYQINDGTNTFGPSYPAHTIVAQQGVPTQVHYVNNLVPFGTLPGPLLQKFLTVDVSFHWANPTNLPMMVTDPTTKAQVGNPGFYNGPQPTVVHLHGFEGPSAFDGGADSWFTPGTTIKGPSFVTDTYTYINTQDPTTLWYHDHVLGETRLNVYAGLAGFYLLRGALETAVTPSLPSGNQEVELVIQDRMFDTNGQLFFPDGNPAGGGLNGDPSNPTVHPYAIPEFFGNVMIVNGKSWPYMNVEPRRYRLRFLNGCNARMLGMTLVDQNTPPNPGPAIWQIGSDGGLFDQPVPMVVPTDAPPPFGPGLAVNLPLPYSTTILPQLFIAPAERADVIVDFTGLTGTFTLVNGSPAPFPSGGTQFDPNLQGQIMQFRVNQPLSSTDVSFNPAVLNATLRSGTNKMVRLAAGQGFLAPGVQPDKFRRLALIEKEGPDGQGGGPAEVLLNNAHYDGISEATGLPITGSKQFNGPNSPWITEVPQIGSTEIWEFVNLTPDAHPIHMHLIQFQVLNRQVFNVGDVVPPLTTTPSYRLNAWEPAFPGGATIWGDGPPPGGVPNPQAYLQIPVGNVIPPDPNEAGWKDTLKMFTGTITRVVARFAPQSVPISGVSAGQNKFAFDPTATLAVAKDAFGYPGGPGYLWHCHILDHEDNDMMRPYQVSNTAFPHDGIVNYAFGKTSPDIGDALTVLESVAGRVKLSDPQQERADVSPLSGPNGTPVGDGVVDYGDVIMILRRAIGLGTW
jgi:FtsP/CotA-like multicopper oxidase with cupredoxin domain